MKEGKRAIFQAASYASQAAGWVSQEAEQVEPEAQIQQTQPGLDDAITYDDSRRGRFHKAFMALRLGTGINPLSV